MLFNSVAFAIFLPAVFGLYWSLARTGYRGQNALVLAASYLFYGWWDYRFLSLIVVSSIVDYWVGIRLADEEGARARKALLGVSLGVNLGFLGVFKYFDFFIDSLSDGLELLGFAGPEWGLRLVLPVGISFYTFQTLSYSIDIYRRQLEPTRDALAFFAFVSFFPQLVAGPIERASALLPQFTRPRVFDTELAKDGMRQILWGFFKKVVVADTLAIQVDIVFANSATASSFDLLLAVCFFALQIYCDFSGYSDIAIGTARLFGFSLMRNFAYPMFARDVAEFWRRWHVSLSTWFRDYLFIPLGGSRTSLGKRIFNLFVTFGISGLWHGANWTYLFWGLLNAAFYVPLMLKGTNRQHLEIVAKGRFLPTLRDVWLISSFFGLNLVAWVMFRSESLGHAMSYFAGFFTQFDNPRLLFDLQIAKGIGLCFLLLGAEWLQRERQHGLEVAHLRVHVRWAIYAAVCITIGLLGTFDRTAFIYFQF